MPLSMVTEVALVEVQARVLLPPGGSMSGVAVRVTVGAGTGMTSIVAWAVTW